HETETPRPAGHLVHDDGHGRNLPMSLEGAAEIVLGRLVRQVANVDVRHLQPRKRKKKLQTKEGGSQAVAAWPSAVEPNFPDNNNLTESAGADKSEIGGGRKKRGGGPPSGETSPPFQFRCYFAPNSTTSCVMFIVGLLEVIFAVNPGMSWFVYTRVTVLAPLTSVS